MSAFQIGALIYLAFGALGTVAMIGRPREPITPLVAVASLILYGLAAALVILFA